jgi:hypothetical protein
MAITTVQEVKEVASLTSEYSEEEILSEIDIVEAELYQKYHLPKRSQFSVNKDYSNFYIYPTNVHEIIRVQGQVETTVDPTGYQIIGSDSNWTFSTNNNFITLLPQAIENYGSKIIRVQHIPKIFNMIATNLVALNLIDTTTVINGESSDSPLAIKIKDRIDKYQELLKPKKMVKSSDEYDYNIYDYISYSQSDLR